MVVVEGALVRVLHVSTAVARQLSRVPMPPVTATQRITMQALASQLRATASSVLVSDASRDPSTVEGAMAEAVEETLRLVEIALGAETSEIASREPAHALESREDEAIEVRAHSPALGDGEGSDEA